MNAKSLCAAFVIVAGMTAPAGAARPEMLFYQSIAEEGCVFRVMMRDKPLQPYLKPEDQEQVDARAGMRYHFYTYGELESLRSEIIDDLPPDSITRRVLLKEIGRGFEVLKLARGPACART